MSSGLTKAGGSALARKMVYKPTQECVSPRRVKAKSLGSNMQTKIAIPPESAKSNISRPSSPMLKRKKKEPESNNDPPIQEILTTNGGDGDGSPHPECKNPDVVEAPKLKIVGLRSPRSPTRAAHNTKNKQALRLLRVILGDNMISLNEQSVNQAIQKHLDVLRLAASQHSTTGTAAAKEEKLLKGRIGRLQSQLKKQKSIMQTALEIKEVELNIRNKEYDQKVVRIQQLSWQLAKVKTQGETSDPPVSTCRGEPEDDESNVTPMMAGSGMNPYFVTDEKLPVEKENGGKHIPVAPSLDSAWTNTTALSLTEYEQRLHDANDIIRGLEEEKIDMEEDFEETLNEAKAKIKQLKSVLISCNARRKEAERQLKKLGHWDETTFSQMLPMPSLEGTGTAHQSRADTSESNSSSVPIKEVTQPLSISEVCSLQTSLSEVTKAKAALDLQLIACQASLANCTKEKDNELRELRQTLDSTEARMMERRERDANWLLELENETKRANDFAADLKYCNAELDSCKASQENAENLTLEKDNEIRELQKLVDSMNSRIMESREKDAIQYLRLQNETRRASDLESNLQDLNTKLDSYGEKIEFLEEELEQAQLCILAFEEKNKARLPKDREDISYSSLEGKHTAIVERTRVALHQAGITAGENSCQLEETQAALRQSRRKMEKKRKRMAAAIKIRKQVSFESQISQGKFGKERKERRSEDADIPVEDDVETSSPRPTSAPTENDVESDARTPPNLNAPIDETMASNSRGQTSEVSQLDVQFDSVKNELERAYAGLPSQSKNDDISLLLESAQESLRNSQTTASGLETKAKQAESKLMFLRKIVLTLVPPEEEQVKA